MPDTCIWFTITAAITLKLRRILALLGHVLGEGYGGLWWVMVGGGGWWKVVEGDEVRRRGDSLLFIGD